jgi:hypothetical protein
VFVNEWIVPESSKCISRSLGELIPMMVHHLHINCRRVRQEGGIRPFQKQVLDAIFSSPARLLIVEAPVGSGKSYIIRQLTEQVRNQPVVLTFPTKILLDAQCNAIRQQEVERGKAVALWPDDSEKWPIRELDGLNVWKYSSEALVAFFEQRPADFLHFKDRGELLGHGLFTLRYSNRQIFVTTPGQTHYCRHKNSS